MATANIDHHVSDLDLEEIGSEDLDLETSPATYEIFTYPADFTLEVLASKWKKKEILIPKFQRQFVWTQIQASRLVESFLLGLPVPPIFFYQQQEDGKFLVVDGQQRLRSIVDFFAGYFGDESNGKRPIFRLTGLNEKSPFLNKTYEDLEQTQDTVWRKLTNSVLRSFVIKQLDPQDDTSIFHIFERLNSGGTFLRPQEIRNCIHHGEFNDLLHKLNENALWRQIIGKPKPDRRQKDIELILRFFALSFAMDKYEKPMKVFLNRFMGRTKRTAGEAQLETFRDAFLKTVSAIHSSLGAKPFHVKSGLNIAVFDSVCPAFAFHGDSIPPDIKKRYEELLANKDYDNYITFRTTDNDIVTKRLSMANSILFGQQAV
jgi:hypothetical protein